MNCEKVIGKLSAYQDGALDPRVAEQVREHLDSCADCRSELEALERLSAVIRPELSPVSAPDGFAQRVMAGLPERPIVIRRRVLRRAFAWVTCAVLLLAAGLFAVRCGVFGPPTPAEKPVSPPAIVVQPPSAEPRVPRADQPKVEQPAPRTPVVGKRESAAGQVGQPARRRPVRRTADARPDLEPAVGHKQEPTGDTEKFAPPERLPSPSVEFARVPIGSERSEVRRGFVARRPAEPERRGTDVKIIARPHDGGLSVGLTVE